MYMYVHTLWYVHRACVILFYLNIQINLLFDNHFIILFII